MVKRESELLFGRTAGHTRQRADANAGQTLVGKQGGQLCRDLGIAARVIGAAVTTRRLARQHMDDPGFNIVAVSARSLPGPVRDSCWLHAYSLPAARNRR